MSEPIQNEIHVLPIPLSVKPTKGKAFEITSVTKIVYDKSEPECVRIAQMFRDKFAMASGVELELVSETPSNQNTIQFTLIGSDESLAPEGYELVSTAKGIVIKAPRAAGLFYGLQTLLQLLPSEIESPQPVSQNWIVPSVKIMDAPRFAWRGLHLDVVRHMMPVEFIKRYLDYMAMHKLNTFHWHLTDDQGWRIEIKRYPKLTEIGAWRNETVVGHASRSKEYDGQRYGGYYTQEEVREIVQYAKERFITVVPEIEMPGHATAAIAAYPELGVTGKQIDVATTWGIFPDIFNVEDHTFEFLENVLEEVMMLFPSKFIHIGGDEAIKDQWKASERIQQQMKEKGVGDEHELQSYFITRIEKFVNSRGRQIIGWDEILKGGLAPNAAVMSWRGTEGGIAAAKSKHYVVMSPYSHLYFDYYQSNPEFEPLAIHGYASLEKVYSYEPIPEELNEDEAKFIMGAQANVWTEYMKTPEHVEYMIFPRIGALSEMLWSDRESRAWEEFKNRLLQQLKRYDQMGINYSHSIFRADYREEKDEVGNLLVILFNQLNIPDIYYTTDGSEPTTGSIKYEKPILVDSVLTVKAATFVNGEIVGGVIEKIFMD